MLQYATQFVIEKDKNMVMAEQKSTQAKIVEALNDDNINLAISLFNTNRNTVNTPEFWKMLNEVKPKHLLTFRERVVA